LIARIRRLDKRGNELIHARGGWTR
jgi:hypothetical protein